MFFVSDTDCMQVTNASCGVAGCISVLSSESVRNLKVRKVHSFGLEIVWGYEW